MIVILILPSAADAKPAGSLASTAVGTGGGEEGGREKVRSEHFCCSFKCETEVSYLRIFQFCDALAMSLVWHLNFQFCDTWHVAKSLVWHFNFQFCDTWHIYIYIYIWQCHWFDISIAGTRSWVAEQRHSLRRYLSLYLYLYLCLYFICLWGGICLLNLSPHPACLEHCHHIIVSKPGEKVDRAAGGVGQGQHWTAGTFYKITNITHSTNITNISQKCSQFHPTCYKWDGEPLWVLYFQAALGVAQEALEREKGGMKALQEQLQSGKVSCCLFFGCLSSAWTVGARACGWVGVLDACTQEKRAGPPSDLDTSVVSGRSNASRHSVARLGGSLVHSTTGVRDFFTPGSSLFPCQLCSQLRWGWWFTTDSPLVNQFLHMTIFEEHTNMPKLNFCKYFQP